MDKLIEKKHLLISIAVLLLLCVAVYSGFQILKPTVSVSNDGSSTKTIEYNGKKYFPRQDIKTFLIMGIDKEGKVADSGSYNNDGACDVAVLAVFDEAAEEYTLLCLNRDTMVEMPVLGVGGKRAGTTVAQLALSHTYGSGLKDSCENTKETVSDFLGGIKIDYYVSFNMDAIGILTDAVGGVKVNVTDDFSAVEPSITKGELVLDSSKALTFIRTRKGVGDQMNISRMERHKEFMNGFFSALGRKLDESDTFVLNAFEDVSEYMVTDCSVDVLGGFASRYSDYTLKEIVSPEGDNKKGTEYIEFYADEDKLDELVIGIFYAEKNV